MASQLTAVRRAEALRQGRIGGPERSPKGKVGEMARGGSERPFKARQELDFLLMGNREPREDKGSKSCSPDLPFSKTPSLLLGGEGVRRRVNSRSRELSLCCSDRPSSHWLAGRRDQSSLGCKEGEAGALLSGCSASWRPLAHLLAQLVWPPLSLERQGLSAAASKKSEDYRFAGGLSLLSHRRPRTLLSLGSTVTAEHCTRTPLGRPGQRLPSPSWDSLLCKVWIVFMAPSFASASFPLGLVFRSSKSK